MIKTITARLFLPILLLVISSASTRLHAQSYEWVKGGGSIISFMTSADDEAVRYMCTDSNGNIYTVSTVGALNILADTFYRNTAYNFSNGVVHNLFASYTCDGTMRFAKLIEGWGVAACGGIEYYNGSVFLTGHLYSSGTHYKHIGEDSIITSGNYAGYTARFDTSGEFEWIRFIGQDDQNTATKVLLPGALAIDGQGGIHNYSFIKAGCPLTQSFTTTVPGTYDIKYDFAGNLVSVNHVQPLDSVWMIAKAVYSKQSNKWYAAIQPRSDYWYAIHTDWNSAVCAFQPNGNIIWMDTTGATGGISTIDYKGGNDLYVCGAGQTQVPFTFGGITVSNTLGYANAVIFKLDTNGVAHWVYNLMGSLGVTSFQDITITSPGKIAATGTFAGLAVHGTDSLQSTAGQGQNVLFTIVDSSGNTIKLDQLSGSAFYDKGTAIASDKTGNIYIGGQVGIEISATGLSAYTSNGGNSDNFLMKYGIDCNCTSMPIASFSHSGTTTVTFTYTGTTTGMDSLRWYFGDGGTSTTNNPVHTYSGTGPYTACVIVYTNCGTDSTCTTIGQSSNVGFFAQNNMHIYPNPAKDHLIIDNGSIGSTIKVFNLLGQQVYQDVVKNEHQLINTKQLLTGSYILMLTDATGMTAKHIFVKE